MSKNKGVNTHIKRNFILKLTDEARRKKILDKFLKEKKEIASHTNFAYNTQFRMNRVPVKFQCFGSVTGRNIFTQMKLAHSQSNIPISYINNYNYIEQNVKKRLFKSNSTNNFFQYDKINSDNYNYVQIRPGPGQYNISQPWLKTQNKFGFNSSVVRFSQNKFLKEQKELPSPFSYETKINWIKRNYKKPTPYGTFIKLKEME